MIKLKTGWLPKSKKNIILQGNRVFLSSPCLADYRTWRSVRRRNQIFLKPYEPQWSDDALSIAFFKRRLKRQKEEQKLGRGSFFLIHEKNSNHIIGGINLNNIQYGPARWASLGYWLDHEKKKQGYMHESAMLVIDYAFDVLKLHRLKAACLPDNERSINLLLKLGFEEEGYAKNYLQINGKWQDHRLFGLISDRKI